MYFEDLKNKLAKKFQILSSDFIYPPQENLGDLSLALFNLAKKMKVNPVDLALNFKQSIENDKSLADDILEVKVVGPYLNIFLRPDQLATATLEEIKKLGENFGRLEPGKKESVMIEYSNANTHKEYHVGHLRNLFFGSSLTKILNFSGYYTIPVSYINDFGIHVAKTLWSLQFGNDKNKWEVALKEGENKGRILGFAYSSASKELVDCPEKKQEVVSIMQEIESKKGDQYKLWQETRNWSIAYLDSVYKELNIHFDHIFYESEVIEHGLKIVDELLQKKIFKKSEGAIIADLSKFNLGVLPIIRSDGTALYPVADLALAKKKFKEYQIDESIYVVDVRQSLYFKQLAKIFDLSGENFKISHLTYDFVTLKSGMMASRSGNIISYDSIFLEAVNRAEKEVKLRHADWGKNKVKSVAVSLAISALKFEMLKVGREKVIVFDTEEALRFDGFTAAYLQYTGARLESVLKKEKLAKTGVKYELLIEDKEKYLLLCLQKFSESIKQASDKRDPSLVARYIFELCQLFNDYYHSVPILKVDKEIAQARLGLLFSVQVVLKIAFDLLGLEYLDEM